MPVPRESRSPGERPILSARFMKENERKTSDSPAVSMAVAKRGPARRERRRKKEGPDGLAFLCPSRARNEGLGETKSENGRARESDRSRKGRGQATASRSLA